MSTPNFNGDEGTFITQQEAKSMIERYLAGKPADTTKGVFFGKNKIMEILNQTDCVGIRIYFAEEELKPQLVLVGAEANMDDQVNGRILDRGYLCPYHCAVGSSLV